MGNPLVKSTRFAVFFLKPSLASSWSLSGRRLFYKVIRAAVLALLLATSVVAWPATAIKAKSWSSETSLTAQQSANEDNRFGVAPPELGAGKLFGDLGFNISAKAFAVVDGSSGEIIWEQNGDERRPPASLTKVMTAIIVLEKAGLHEEVVVSREAASIGEASIWLQEGEKLTVHDLLYAMLLASANDAAYALAEHVAGSSAKFVEMMNAKAEEVGAHNTHFVNPCGLDDDRHYSTAKDLAIITRYAMGLGVFRDIVSTPKTSIRSAGRPDREIENTNKLVGRVSYINGVKTGYTEKAGWNMILSGERDGRSMVVVLLGCNAGMREVDALKLWDYCFANFEKVKVVDASNERYLISLKDGKGYVSCSPESDYSMFVNKDDKEKLRVFVIPDWNIRHPVQKGEEVGIIIVALDGRTIKELALVRE